MKEGRKNEKQKCKSDGVYGVVWRNCNSVDVI